MFLNSYSPIALFLCIILKLEEKSKRLFYYDVQNVNQMESKDHLHFFSKEEFVSRVIRVTITYGEDRVFELLLEHVITWEIFFSDELIRVCMNEDKLKYLKRFLMKLNENLLKNNGDCLLFSDQQKISARGRLNFCNGSTDKSDRERQK